MGLAPGRPARAGCRSSQGGEWFTAGWGSVPAARGRDARRSWRSLAGGSTSKAPPAPPGRALVLLGADLSATSPTTTWPRGPWPRAEFVVAVAGHRSATVDRADVVLPAAVAHERPGTTTNIEGRVSRLGQKLVAPGLGLARLDDRRRAGRRARRRLGRRPALTELWDEIERLAPAYAGHHHGRARLGGRAATGSWCPSTRRPGAGARAPEPIDPMALPGVESVERQGAPPRVGLAEPPAGERVALRSSRPAAPDRARDRPGRSWPSAPPAGWAPHVPPPDSYSLRLVSARRLYDAGHCRGRLAVAGRPGRRRPWSGPTPTTSTAWAWPPATRCGSARPGAALVLPAEADAGVPRGVVAVDFNLPAPDRRGRRRNAAAALIDAAAVVTDVRLETVG